MLKTLENFYYFVMIFPIILSFLLSPVILLYDYHKVSLEKKHIEGIFIGYAYKNDIEEVLIEEEEEVDSIPHKTRNIELIGKHYEKLKDKIVE